MTFPNWHIHTGYIALAAILSLGAYIGVHSWLAEHDARLLAVQQEKISEAILPVLGERVMVDAGLPLALGRNTGRTPPVLHSTC